MKYLYHKDNKRRIKVFRCEITNRLLKSLCFNRIVTKNYREQLLLLGGRRFRYSTKIMVHNRCVITNQARSVSKLFRVERRTFREMARFGLIYGVRAGLW